MLDVLVAIPVLRRPQKVATVLEAFRGTRVLFLPDEDDYGTLQALEEHKADYAIAPPASDFGVPTYASKVNHAYRITDSEYILYAADDVIPSGTWRERALGYLSRHPKVGLLATNDMSHPLVTRGKLATHGIVSRSYVETYGSASLKDSGPIFHEGYRHWCCDVEVSYAARMRGAFAYVPDVIIRHARDPRRDEVYALGASFATQDRKTMRSRCPGWPEMQRTRPPRI
ncbi:MAG: hypothetical protein LC650_04950 [Actinobacteria bacterium]|nr:hypothetical protein [Actinomycetota bacterium]